MNNPDIPGEPQPFRSTPVPPPPPPPPTPAQTPAPTSAPAPAPPPARRSAEPMPPPTQPTDTRPAPPEQTEPDQTKATNKRPESVERTDLSDLLDQLGDGTDDDVAPINSELTDPRDIERPTGVETAVIESTGGLEFSPEFASFVSRLLGLIVDNAVTSLMMLPGIVLAAVGGSGLLTVLGIVLALAGFVVAARLYARSVSTTGQWFGNRVATTKVVDISNGALITSSNAMARFLIRSLISPVFLFGFLIAFGNSQRRTFHDQIASSIVSRPDRAVWTADDNPNVNNT